MTPVPCDGVPRRDAGAPRVSARYQPAGEFEAAFRSLRKTLFFVLNLFGIKLRSEVNRRVTWWKIIIPSLTAIHHPVGHRDFLIYDRAQRQLHSPQFGSAHGFLPYGTSTIFDGDLGDRDPVRLPGLPLGPRLRGEAKKPQRHVPLAAIVSVLIAMGDLRGRLGVHGHVDPDELRPVGQQLLSRALQWPDRRGIPWAPVAVVAAVVKG